MRQRKFRCTRARKFSFVTRLEVIIPAAGSASFEFLISHSGRITEIAIDQQGRKLYWVDAGTNAIKRANLDGSGSETIVSDVPGIGDLAVDEQDRRIVWVSYVDGSAKLMSAALDGTDVRWRLMNAQAARYTAIAIGPKPAWTPADVGSGLP